MAAATFRRALATAFALFLISAVSAEARPPAASWRFDEGAGRIVNDSGPNHLNGTIPAATDPAWITGVQGTALRFARNGQVTLPDDAGLEPATITIAAWVRGFGSPGTFRYVFSKGSSSCLRGSYGVYTAQSGGAAFYVSGDGWYTVSPEVSPKVIWDGRWHRLVGSYDGHVVRLYVDGLRIGSAVEGPTHIEYGLTSKTPIIGNYSGGCQLPFSGDIDDVGVWDAALSDAEVRADAQPPAPMPGSGPVGPTPGVSGPPHPPANPGYSTTPRGCTSVKVNRRSVRAARRTRIIVTAYRGSMRLAKARVALRAPRVRRVARTNSRGRARFVVRPRHSRSRLTVAVTTKRLPARCSRPVAHIRVRR